MRGRTLDRLRVAAHYVRDGLQITQEATGVAAQALLPRARRRLQAGWAAAVRVSALYLSRAWERSRPGLVAALRHAREDAVWAWRALLAGLARGRDRAGPALAWAWHQIRVGLARAGHLLRRGLAAAWDQYLHRVWNSLAVRLRRRGDPPGDPPHDPPDPLTAARNPLRLDGSQLRVMYAMAAAVAVAALALLAYGMWARATGSLADQVAALSLSVAVGTLVAASIAGLIALVAYRRATQTPDLSFEIDFPFSEPNRPQLMVDTSHRRRDGAPYLAHFEQVRAKARISNRAPFAARHPACRIELIGLEGRDFGPGWTSVIAGPDAQPTVIQWDGGADGVIHGEWERVLDLDFRSVVCLARGPAKMVARVVADGAPARVCEIPVDLLHPRDWLRRHPEWSRPVPVRDVSVVAADDRRTKGATSPTVSE